MTMTAISCFPRQHILTLALLLTLLVFNNNGVVVVMAKQDPDVKRDISIVNESGHRVEIYWINQKTGETSLMTSPHILFGATFKLNSFVGHKFEAREMPHQKTGLCRDEERGCKSSYFTVNDNVDQIVTVQKDMEIYHADEKTVAQNKAQGLLSDCKARATQALLSPTNNKAGDKVIDDLAACIKSKIAETMEITSEEVAFQERIREYLGTLYETYTCADEELEQTPEKYTDTWVDDGRVKHVVKVLHDRPKSRIHVVENFITEKECKAMEDQAAPKLQKAVVADYDGGSTLSKHRVAWQAGIKVPWDQKKNPITVLSRRVYSYVNHVLDLNIDKDGQEDLMSIQYFGRGANETEPDQYMPHCDGDCSGDKHRTGNRVATMVLYCTIPQRGGATNFRNSGVHVKPVKGNAVFFSYIHPIDRTMDTGFTEHSGCPVIEGEKKIVTQWVRLGVDAENPADSFNALGIKKTVVDGE